MLRQSQALEMAEEATDASQVGLAVSASSARGARRARTAFVEAGEFPDLIIEEVFGHLNPSKEK